MLALGVLGGMVVSVAACCWWAWALYRDNRR